MKSWQKMPDDVLLDSIKMTALMSFCFGIGLLASSVIGIGAQTQLAETVGFDDGTSSTNTTTSVSGGTSSSGDTTNTVDPTTTSSPNTSTAPTPGTSGSTSYVTPSLTFTSGIPQVVASDLTVTLNAISIYRPQLVVRGLNVNKIIVLDPLSQQLPTANFLVRFSQLVPGRYELMAKGYISSSGTLIEVVGPRFEIPTPVSVSPNQTTNSNTGTISSTTSTVTNNTTNSGAGSITASSSPANTASTTQSTITDQDEVEVPKLELVIPDQSIYRGFVPVQVQTTVSLPEAFIYLQSANFSSPRLVGRARYYNSSTLMLMVDTNQLPNGEYRIYASTKFEDVMVESNKRRFVIYNATTTSAITNPTISTTTNPFFTSPTASTTIQPKIVTEPVVPPKPVNVEPINSPVYVPPKIVSREDDNSNESVEQKNTVTENDNDKPVRLTDELKSLIPIVLKEYEPKLNQRLKTFGNDLQADGADVSKLRKKIEDDLMAILLGDYRLQFISTEAKKRLRAEVERLVVRAEKVELLIKKSEVTTENLDELVKTLKSATSSSEEALVDTSSPREFGLVREDILQIESVSPIVSLEAESTSTKIYTEIRGKAVPNSLVTLYIYSDPVMVTVRADADGTFVYVYEKDLEDGDHEVYVALTTTEGEVVVKSPSFQFIREAQAFNSPDSSNGDNLVPATAGAPLTQNPYFVVISITLLVVSFIFFLLGFKTSNKKDEFTVV